MCPSAKFTFVHTTGKSSEYLNNKSVKEYLMKWSIKGHISIQYYSFNEQFNIYKKQEFAEAFFKDPNVLGTLKKTYDGSNWIPVGEELANVKVEGIPCTILTLEFFDRILDESNGIVRGNSGDIIHCLDEEYNEYFMIGDKLRMMLIDSSSDVYNLYNESERNQLLFRLLKFLCFGGQWCQYEDNINPYIDNVKLLYKDLLRVERVTGTDELVIRSTVIKVIASNEDGGNQIPEDPNNPHNFLYLIIDPFTRQVTTFLHHWGGSFVV